MPSFQCVVCGADFEIDEATLAKYPRWTPRYCRQHKGGSATAAPKADAGTRSAPQRLPPAHAVGSKTWWSSGASSQRAELSPREVLARHHAGPTHGVFTDGGAEPNPGPGGWGFVWVENGEIVKEAHGHDRHTTNNRMELTAIIEALKAMPRTQEITLYSDSDLCVKTLTLWAKGWKARGWRRKDGEIKNLELVQEAYDLLTQHPGVRMQWIKAHDGSRWNEYADALATLGKRGG